MQPLEADDVVGKDIAAAEVAGVIGQLPRPITYQCHAQKVPVSGVID